MKASFKLFIQGFISAFLAYNKNLINLFNQTCQNHLSPQIKINIDTKAKNHIKNSTVIIVQNKIYKYGKTDMIKKYTSKVQKLLLVSLFYLMFQNILGITFQQPNLQNLIRFSKLDLF